jgi:hypothetical protein
MDRNAARELLLTGFKPKEKLDFATPYLGALDGELKLVGLSGKARLALEEQCIEQQIGKDGKATNKVNARKFMGLCIATCVRMRETGEPLLELADVLGEQGDGGGELLSIDSEPYLALLKDVAEFIGYRAPADAKNASEPTGDGSDTSSSPPASAEPLTSSSPESTPPS